MIDSTFKKANILIVDDQEANIAVLEGFLEMQEYLNVKSTTDPRQVLQLYTSHQADLILLDLSMPYLSGFEVMEQLRQVVPPGSFLPILVLTADVTTEAKMRALSGGASDFLTKPFDLIEVGLRIRNLLKVSYLQQQLLNQNQILEEKVEERTAELKANNEELRLAKERAETSDQLKTSFINNISHEIRTPLNGILGFSQILSDPEITPKDREEYVALLNDCSDRLINTITNIMDISLINSGNLKVQKRLVELHSFVSDVYDKFILMSNLTKLELTVSSSDTENKIHINTDPFLLEKILSHLVDNAIKFTRSGTVEIIYEHKNKQLFFSIRDTGIGISDENKDRIFQIFSQENISMNRSYEGAGLGLPIAKGLLELLGGTIGFVTEKGKGSVFEFSVPVSEV